MAADPSSSSQSLPVVVKKGRHQLGGLTEGPHGQHWLCPHGKLTAFVDGRGWLRIQHLSSPQRQATISTHTYSRWQEKNYIKKIIVYKIWLLVYFISAH